MGDTAVRVANLIDDTGSFIIFQKSQKTGISMGKGDKRVINHFVPLKPLTLIQHHQKVRNL
jgi:hypothetical protein